MTPETKKIYLTGWDGVVSQFCDTSWMSYNSKLFRRHVLEDRVISYNHRTNSEWPYPVSNEILSCFSETTDQNHKSHSWSLCRGENFDLQLHPDQRPEPSKTCPHSWIQRTRTWTSELFQKQRVHHAGRFSAEVPYHVLTSTAKFQHSPI